MSGENFRKDETAKVLSRLKDFQLRTAEYVFRRFYQDASTTERFLVADEVGLGKTLVARGVIALAIEYLEIKGIRIDIVYICSNQSIASQNIHRLNVSGVQEFVKPTRLTLLPMHMADIQKNHINYVSLTPGTSFDLRSSEGVVDERALIYHILKGQLEVSPAGLRKLLQCRVNKKNWKWWTQRWTPGALDPEIRNEFVEAITSNTEFYERLKKFCLASKWSIQWKDPERLRLVAELRTKLAEISLDKLEPDLVILDEFQRFKKLLDGDNPQAELAQKLFRYKDVKTLLLSATPYKMLTLDYEEEDDHYPDFLKTLDFLFDSNSELEKVKREIQNFRQSLYSSDSAKSDAIRFARDALQARLRQVMCRTERVGSTREQDAMLSEFQDKPVLESQDLHEAVLADRVASSVGARDIIEYWKSSPYLINFLRRYEFRKKLEAQCEEPSDALISALSANASRLLKKADMMRYRKLLPSNPRMRDLFSLTIDQDLWKILWMPPSMPYSRPEGAYANVKTPTKYLVFSAWNVVPDAIASLCSFEAERRMLEQYRKEIRHDELYRELRPLLKYSRKEDRLSGMPVVGMLYPGPSLASLVDPLQIALDYQGEGLISTNGLLEEAERILEPHIHTLTEGAPENGIEDQRWYWAAPAMMAGKLFPGLKNWLLDDEHGWSSVSLSKKEEDKGISREPEEESAHDGSQESLKEHLQLFVQAMDRCLDPPLGRTPQDLMEVLSLLAVAGPGACSLRALHRQCPGLTWDHSALLKGTVMISEGFRTLFNLPETMGLLRGGDSDTVYWQLVLKHCLQGNIQSLLDEQAHCLCESLGVIDESEDKRAEAIGESIGSSLSIRTSPLQLDDVRVYPENRKVKLESYRTRCRFALRFAELKDEKGSTLARADTVRDAFNSPFRPFILASTSIGQEGLDFHTWCHAVIHWNLPSNPVDLEQREGRVHRYKGHAIRKNIAMNYGLESIRSEGLPPGDPWKWMFCRAAEEKAADMNDLWPFWLYEVEGGAKIERHVPILDYSREALQFKRLKRMLAAYRLVFGQPRQEDLLAYLMDRLRDGESDLNPDDWRISLEPPGSGYEKYLK